MDKYHPKSTLAAIGDHLLRAGISLMIGIAWFVGLWGIRLSAFTAGTALGCLFWLCGRQFGKRSTQRREKQMRRMIGGELAVARLLLLSPKHAGFQTALWITPRFPLVMQKAVDWGVVGRLQGKKTLVRLIAQHESIPVNAQQMIEVARELQVSQMEQCILCLTAPATNDAKKYAEQSFCPIQLLSREELINYAGMCSPATDEQLSALGKRKKMPLNRSELAERMLDPSRAPRYFWYGLGLSALALATGQSVYPIPALICLSLYLLCKLRSPLQQLRTRIAQRNPFSH